MSRMLRDPVLRDTARRLRRDATAPERVLWRALRRGALGTTFRRQHAIGAAVADFTVLELRLIVEVDGGQHGGMDDAERDRIMQVAGWHVLRYWNNDVLENVNGVLADLARVIAERKAALREAPPP